MKKKILSILTVLLVGLVVASTVSAGGNVGLNSVAFRSGSLIATGTFTALGGYSEGVIAKLFASGIPVVTCTNQGGTEAPGQNPPKVSADGEQFIGPQPVTKKGTAPLDVTAKTGLITGIQGGCPNNNWTATIDSVIWTNATIIVTDAETGAELLRQDYTFCSPYNPDTLNCTPVQ